MIAFICIRVNFYCIAWANGQGAKRSIQKETNQIRGLIGGAWI